MTYFITVLIGCLFFYLLGALFEFRAHLMTGPIQEFDESAKELRRAEISLYVEELRQYYLDNPSPFSEDWFQYLKCLYCGRGYVKSK